MWIIVLQNTIENDIYKVIDWQQRLITISIMILAIIDILNNFIENNIDVENNKERVYLLLEWYIWTKTRLLSLSYTTKLELNKNNNDFYKNYFLEHTANIWNLNDSERLLYEAYNYFKRQFQEKFINDSWKNITEFFEEIISRKLIFIQIVVDDDVNAYTLFETLNARWVGLTKTDLLKNYLFSLISNYWSNIAETQKIWKNIVELVWLKDFPNFLRYFINSRNQLVKHGRLLKEVKKIVNSPLKVLELLRELEKTACLYVAIKNPNDDFWNLHPNKKEIQKSLKELSLFWVTQPISLLFAVYEKLWDLFADILRYISIISFRYNVIWKLDTNELEKIYNKISQQIFSREIQSKQDIINITISSLSSVYVSDSDFENAFENKSISIKQWKKIVKYILTKIENYLSWVEYDFEGQEIIIEHILPENYTKEWEDIFWNEIDDYIYKLWNYTLLKEGENIWIWDKSFEGKREIYKNSWCKISSEKLNYDEWNISTLSERQKELAKIAKSIWRISI